MKETKTLDEVLDELLENVMETALKADTLDKEYDIDIESDNSNPDDDIDPYDDEEDDFLEEMYTEIAFMLEVANLMTDFALCVVEHCTGKLSKLNGVEE